MRTALGLSLVAAALLVGLIAAHVSRLKRWDRPRFAQHRRFAPLARWARRALLAVGLAFLLLDSPRLAAAVAIALAALWARLLRVRSPAHALRRLRREVAVREAASPGTDRGEIVARILHAWHPEWGEDLAKQIAQDRPRLEDVARIVTRMERGWPS